MSNSFMARARKSGAHVVLQIFVGENSTDRSLAGTLRFRPEEYKDFVFRVLGTRGLAELDERDWTVRELSPESGPFDIPIPNEKSVYEGLGSFLRQDTDE